MLLLFFSLVFFIYFVQGSYFDWFTFWGEGKFFPLPCDRLSTEKGGTDARKTLKQHERRNLQQQTIKQPNDQSETRSDEGRGEGEKGRIKANNNKKSKMMSFRCTGESTEQGKVGEGRRIRHAERTAQHGRQKRKTKKSAKTRNQTTKSTPTQ